MTGLGFYHDDWVLLEMLSHHPDFLGGVKLFTGSSFMVRPLNTLHIPLLFSMFRDHPMPYQITWLILEAVQAWLLFKVVERLTSRPGLALTAAILALIHPGRGISRYWLASSGQTFAIILALSSMIFLLDWFKRPTPWRLTAALAAYLAGLLSYESIAFFPMFIWGGLAVRNRSEGQDWRSSCLKPARPMLYYIAALGLALFWQRWGVGHFFPLPPSRPIALNLVHFLTAMTAGAYRPTIDSILLCLRALPASLSELNLGLLAIGAALAAILASILSADTAETSVPRPGYVALAAALAGLVGAALPYALSQSYIPSIKGVMSRTTVTGSLAAAVIAAVLLDMIRSKLPREAGSRGRYIALSAIIVLSFWTDWQVTRHLAQSWTLQQEVIRATARQFPTLPPGAALIVAEVPNQLNENINRAIVFDAPWDLNAALQLATGRYDTQTNILSPRLSFRKDAVCEEFGGAILVSYPYKNLFLYKWHSDKLIPLTAPPQGQHWY